MKSLNKLKWLLKKVKVTTDNTKNYLTLKIFMEIICCKHQFMSYLVLYAILWLQKRERYNFVMQTLGEVSLFQRKKRMKELKKEALLSEF